MVPFIQKLYRRISLLESPFSKARKLRLQLLGAKIGLGTVVPARFVCTWPHHLRIGSRCVLQEDIFFNIDNYWRPGPSIIIGNGVFIGRSAEFNIRTKLVIGDDSLIAAGVKMIDHDHGTKRQLLMKSQPGAEAAISVGRDVWVGANAILLKGVAIGDGVVIGAGAVVTKSIPPNEIWAGVPARKIAIRE
jgi:acetyltransferase-like isoleucine patch superfamily enzyme